MGKAARLRKHRGIAPPEKSAYARIMRFSQATLKRYERNGPTTRIAAETAKFVQDRLPKTHVFRYRNWDVPEVPLNRLGEQLRGVRFPFPLTLIDTSNFVVGEAGGTPVHLVGMLCCESEKGLWEKPAAIAFAVVADGTDEWWSTPVLSLTTLRDALTLDERTVRSEILDEEAGIKVGKALLTTLGMLECANVDVLAALDPPRPGHVAHGVPYLDIVVRQAKTRREAPEEHNKVDWSHRWETAAHFKHFKKGPVFNSAPSEKRMMHPDHGECVRIWCPSYIKGPPNKPLILKVRVVG